MPLYNISGALIFSTYVVSALVLTVLLCSSLIFHYRKLLKAEDAKRSIDLERRLQIFSALSVVSFSTLSYHMLSYLIVSIKAGPKHPEYCFPSEFGEMPVLLAVEIRGLSSISGNGSLLRPSFRTLQ